MLLSQIRILDGLSWSCVATLELSGRIPVNTVTRLFRIRAF